MDGSDVESGDGLHEDQRGLQELLCRAHGAAVEGNGDAAVCEWFQVNLAAGDAGVAAEMEEAADDFC
jgi:hypothetical protein